MLLLVLTVELGKLSSKVNLARSGWASGSDHSWSGRRRVVRLRAVLNLRLSGHLNELWPERSRRGQSPGCSHLQRARSDSDRLSLVGRASSWLRALDYSLSDMLQRLLFNFIFISITEIVLEEGRRGSWGRGAGSRYWSSGVVGLGVIPFCGVGAGWLIVLFLVGPVGVAGVAGDVGELSLVAIGVNVSVLAADDAVGASRLLLEGTVGCLVTECETTVVIDLESRKYDFKRSSRKSLNVVIVLQCQIARHIICNQVAAETDKQ